MNYPTFQELDRQRAAREAKRRECIERLARVLAREFDADELRFIWNLDYCDAVLGESFELARIEVTK